MMETQSPVETNNNAVETYTDEVIRQFLVFRVAEQEYAVDVLSVEDIVGYTDITPVPGSLHYMKGLMNLRGNILHVVDTRLRLGLPEKESDKMTVIIVVSTQTRKFGLIADMVNDVLNVPESSISEPPDFGEGAKEEIDHGLISDIIRMESRIIMVLKLDEITAGE